MHIKHIYKTLILYCILISSSSSAYFWDSWSKTQKTSALIAASVFGLSTLGYYLYSFYAKPLSISNSQSATKEKLTKDINQLIQQLPETHRNTITTVTYPLHYAAQYGLLELVQNFTQKYDPNAKDTYGDTPLHKACAFGANPEIIKLLLHAGAYVNEQDNNGNTPLIKAVLNNNADFVKILLQKKANKTQKNKFGESALCWAQKLGNPAIIAQLQHLNTF